MEFITVEQFKEQPIEVQNVFLDWWKPSVGDVYCNLYNNQQDNFLIINKCQLEMFKTFKEDIKLFGIPLLSEGQIRRFIEDKARCKVMIEYTSCENIVIKICTQDEVTGALRYNRKLTFPNNRFDLINSYWKVACSVAKEELDNDKL